MLRQKTRETLCVGRDAEIDKVADKVCDKGLAERGRPGEGMTDSSPRPYTHGGGEKCDFGRDGSGLVEITRDWSSLLPKLPRANSTKLE